MTALSEAFSKVGVRPEDVEFDRAIAKYLNSGGSISRALARLNIAAARMSGVGHSHGSQQEGHRQSAQTRQPVEDGEANKTVSNGQKKGAPSSSSNRGGEGLCAVAKSGQSGCAFPVREPKPQRAPIDFGAASVVIKTKLAQSVLDRVKTSDGRAWGDVGAHELDGMERDGALAQAVKSHIGVLSNAQRFKTIRELMNAETFEAIRSQVHGA